MLDRFAKSLGGWGAPLISLFVLAAFTAICVLIFFHSVPTESKDLANVLFGALATMATSVINYWVSSPKSDKP